MAAVSDLLRIAGRVPNQRTHDRARQWAILLSMLVVLVLGTIAFAPARAWADGVDAPTPAPSPDSAQHIGNRQFVPIPTAQVAPTSSVPKIGQSTDITIVEAPVPGPLPVGLVAITRDNVVAGHPAVKHRSVHHRLVADDQYGFAHSLVYAGTAALVIASSGLMLLGFRRRLW
jgi:hypothetical protein